LFVLSYANRRAFILVTSVRESEIGLPPLVVQALDELARLEVRGLAPAAHLVGLLEARVEMVLDRREAAGLAFADLDEGGLDVGGSGASVVVLEPEDEPDTREANQQAVHLYPLHSLVVALGVRWPWRVQRPGQGLGAGRGH